MSDRNSDESIHGQPGSHVNVNRIEVSERTLSILAIVVGVVAFVTSLWSIH